MSEILSCLRTLYQHVEGGGEESEGSRTELRPLLNALRVATEVETIDETEATTTVASRRHFEAALANGLRGQPGAVLELLRCLRDSPTLLNWWQNQNYRQSMGSQFLEGYSSCLLVGPPGSLAPIKTPGVKIGLFLLGPHIDYPAHWHPATEMYLLPLALYSHWPYTRTSPIPALALRVCVGSIFTLTESLLSLDLTDSLFSMWALTCMCRTVLNVTSHVHVPYCSQYDLCVSQYSH